MVPKVLPVLLGRCAANAAQYHEMVRVVAWVLDHDVLELVLVGYQEVLCTRLHLPSETNHVTYPTITLPLKGLVGEEVLCNEFYY